MSYINVHGDSFDSYEEAIASVTANMLEKDDLIEVLDDYITLEEILDELENLNSGLWKWIVNKALELNREKYVEEQEV